MQINDLKKKKKNINHISDYISDHFGFDYLAVEEKIFSKNLLIEDEKIKVLKFSQKQKKKEKIPMKMFFYKKPILKSRVKNFNAALGLDIININSAIAEAAIIKTALSILKEEGYTNFQIVLNAIGDKESQQNWQKALSAFYRENKDKLKKIEQKKITKEPLSILFANKEYLNTLNAEAPSSLEFLSDKNIQHFQEVIEFLENFKINYTVDEKLVGEKLLFSKTIFKIFAEHPKTKKREEVAFGGRYDEIAAKTVHKRQFSAIGLTLHFQKKVKQKIKLKEKKVNIHLLKIGSTAKLKYLDIIDTFKNLKVPIRYDIEEEKISKQIQKAEKDKADYTLIMGEIEAKQDKVLIRKMKDSSQIEVSTDDLEKYIKKFIK
ncbi:MAG: ATP phosphoribosyltransferase regulatory subunit [Candidatus Pacebacteria bacterium]|nr:ATP phosphoribosyltransferase regulatory subunit [Candidatus Paceibacterota bacterium]